MRRIIISIVALALVLPAAATAKPGAVAPPQVKALQAQVKALQAQARTQARQIAALQSAVAQAQGSAAQTAKDLTKLTDVFVCTTAVELTIDYTFFDLFDVLAGQPEQYQGQTAPDNGACAAAGMTPPTPAFSTAAAETPMQHNMRSIARMLGVLAR
jgi:uncharacterized coiled-coil protein SlyX